jgi:hypothetical protein
LLQLRQIRYEDQFNAEFPSSGPNDEP